MAEAEPDITERQASGITVLTLKGKITRGEGSVKLRHTVERLTGEGKKRIVIDLAGVSYVDSSGILILTWSVRHVMKVGGRMTWSGLSRKMQDLLVITKLLTVVDVYERLDLAIAAMSTSNAYAACPLDGCGRQLLVPAGRQRPWLKCYRCGTQFRINTASPLLPATTHAAVMSLRVPTYADESLFVAVGQPAVFRLEGRLDLFAAGVCTRVWNMLAPPRRGILCLTRRTVLSEAGFESLLSLCSRVDGDSQAVILKVGEVSAEGVAVPSGPPVYSNKRAALKAVGVPPAESINPLLVKLRWDT